MRHGNGGNLGILGNVVSATCRCAVPVLGSNPTLTATRSTPRPLSGRSSRARDRNSPDHPRRTGTAVFAPLASAPPERRPSGARPHFTRGRSQSLRLDPTTLSRPLLYSQSKYSPASAGSLRRVSGIQLALPSALCLALAWPAPLGKLATRGADAIRASALGSGLLALLVTHPQRARAA